MNLHYKFIFCLAFILSALSSSVSAANNDNPIIIEQFPEMTIMSMAIGAENNINIGSISGGGGAGKATFKELSITKLPDTTTPHLFTLLATGQHIDELTITHGNVTWTLKLVMIQEYKSAGSTGRNGGQEETWILQFGAMKINVDGTEACWSRVLNEASCDVN